MTASTAVKKAPRNYKEREHRYTKLPMKDLLRTRMDELNVKNVDLQMALGYPQANVIAMMKMGTMRLPANKAIEVARVLQLDPAFILAKLLNENDPALWDSIQKVMGNKIVSDNELELVKFVRTELDGYDPDLAKTPEFVAAVKPVLANIKKDNVKSLAKHIESIDKAKVKKVVQPIDVLAS